MMYDEEFNIFVVVTVVVEDEMKSKFKLNSMEQD